MKEKVNLYLSLRGAEPDHKIQVVCKTKHGDLGYKQMTLTELLIEFDKFNYPTHIKTT